MSVGPSKSQKSFQLKKKLCEKCSHWNTLNNKQGKSISQVALNEERENISFCQSYLTIWTFLEDEEIVLKPIQEPGLLKLYTYN